MEDLKNENEMEQRMQEEPVIEQRPSTKYGRTAYQQQMQEELAAQGQLEDEVFGQQNSWQEQSSYEREKPAVKTIFFLDGALIKVLTFSLAPSYIESTFKLKL